MYKHQLHKVVIATTDHPDVINILVNEKQQESSTVKAMKYFKDMKAITWELQHRLVVTDMDKRKLKKVVKNKQTARKRVWKLKENNVKARFQERIRASTDLNCSVYGMLIQMVF